MQSGKMAFFLDGFNERSSTLDCQELPQLHKDCIGSRQTELSLSFHFMLNEDKTREITWNREDVQSAGQQKTLDDLRAVVKQELQGRPDAYKPDNRNAKCSSHPQDDLDSIWPTLKAPVDPPGLSDRDTYTLSSVAYPDKCLTLNTDNNDVFVRWDLSAMGFSASGR